MQILLSQVIPSLILSAFLLVGFASVKAWLLAWSQRIGRQ